MKALDYESGRMISAEDENLLETMGEKRGETKEETWQASIEFRLTAVQPFREFGTCHRGSPQVSLQCELEFGLVSPLLDYREDGKLRRFVHLRTIGNDESCLTDASSEAKTYNYFHHLREAALQVDES